MKAWNFKVKSNPQKIIKKLDSSLGAADGFVFNMEHDKKGSVIFKAHKRVVNYLNFIRYNQIVVNGKISKADIENESGIEISFNQNFITILYVSVFFVLGLLAIISGISYSTIMFIPAGILFVIGITLWMDVRKNFKKDIQKYKTLISEILEL